MKRKILTYFGVVAIFAFSLFSCGGKIVIDKNEALDFSKYTDITEEEANQIINNFYADRAVNDIDTLIFKFESLDNEDKTITEAYINFDNKNLYFYKSTIEISGTELKHESYIEVEGYHEYVVVNNLDGTATETIGELVDSETTFSNHSNSILEYIKYNEDMYATLTKHASETDVSYSTYGNYFKIDVTIDQTTAEGSFFGNAYAVYAINGLLIELSYEAEQTVDGETTPYEIYYSVEYDVELN